MKKLPTLLLIILTACSSTNVSVSNNFSAKTKKIAIGFIKLSAQTKSNHNTDTVCICTAQTTQNALIPYLQQAGFTVINLPITNFTDKKEIIRIADSAKLDYILTGVGIVDIVG